jgi:NADPH2:quinone reductase
MRAVLCTAFDGPDGLVIGEAEDPQPAEDEVLIDVRAASVSFMDKLMTEGGYQLRPELPYSPGTEAAGVVISTGANVTRFKPGERVAGQLWYGGYAEKVAAKHWKCVPIPDDVDFATASTVLHNYLTAYHALIDRCALRNKEFLLVTGATGGVGLAAMDMGRMLGAQVIAGIGSDAKSDAALKAGAFAAVNYRSQDLRDRIREISGGNGLDVCFEMIGGETFLALARSMAWGGRISPIGFVGGEIPALPMNLPLLKGFSVVGVFSGAWLDRFPEQAAAAAGKVMGWIAKGKLTPRVDRVMPLAQAADALRLLDRREVMGRIVLETYEGSARGNKG